MQGLAWAALCNYSITTDASTISKEPFQMILLQGCVIQPQCVIVLMMLTVSLSIP